MIYKNFDSMTWAGNREELERLERKLRYSEELNKSDKLQIAFILSCYNELVYSKTNNERNYISNTLKKME